MLLSIGESFGCFACWPLELFGTAQRMVQSSFLCCLQAFARPLTVPFLCSSPGVGYNMTSAVIGVSYSQMSPPPRLSQKKYLNIFNLTVREAKGKHVQPDIHIPVQPAQFCNAVATGDSLRAFPDASVIA